MKETRGLSFILAISERSTVFSTVYLAIRIYNVISSLHQSIWSVLFTQDTQPECVWMPYTWTRLAYCQNWMLQLRCENNSNDAFMCPRLFPFLDRDANLHCMRQKQATSGLIELMAMLPSTTLFFVNAWTWGYEDILKAISIAFRSRVGSFFQCRSGDFSLKFVFRFTSIDISIPSTRTSPTRCSARSLPVTQGPRVSTPVKDSAAANTWRSRTGQAQIKMGNIHL